ncbi:MAG TPA: phosphotransferase [Verrucomicrobiales bacterium]|nr:phosphotransferase [Verrucomicrobiales bacterium]
MTRPHDAMVWDQDNLSVETWRRFERFAGRDLIAEPIVRGGSGRTFYRLRLPGDNESMILMQYTLDRPDHGHFLPASRFLDGLGVRVPKVLDADDTLHLVWLEDLGREDLWSLRDQPWSIVFPYYRAALREAAKLHRIHESDIDCPLQPPFDAALYRWEQEYFVRHFLEKFCGLSSEEGNSVLTQQGFSTLTQDLAALPRSLVHRDFQSQNVMVKNGSVYLIDYQGIRWGRPEYDLASLLLDPYVYLTRDMRESLLDFYLESFQPDRDPSDFREIYRACAAQRLMQALGAYGYLSLTAGKTFYLNFIPMATQRLAMVLEEGKLLEFLLPFLRSERLALP